MCVGSDFALVDHTVLMVMEEFDRVFDRQNVVMPLDIDLIDHRGESGRFTRTGRTGYEDEAAGLFAHVGDDLWQTESLECFDLVGNGTKHRSNRAFLIEEVGTKTRHPF